jgi:proteasome lid subunit RPN8/RPN11
MRVVMAKTSLVSMSLEMLNTIFEGARYLHPKETILMLRGKKKKDVMHLVDLVVPPLATYGHGFANYPLHLLPMDFSLVGTVHSHPSGNKTPSEVDFNHFFGRIMMIVGYPYANEHDVVVYNSDGERLPLQITKEQNRI